MNNKLKLAASILLAMLIIGLVIGLIALAFILPTSLFLVFAAIYGVIAWGVFSIFGVKITYFQAFAVCALGLIIISALGSLIRGRNQIKE